MNTIPSAKMVSKIYEVSVTDIYFGSKDAATKKERILSCEKAIEEIGAMIIGSFMKPTNH